MKENKKKYLKRYDLINLADSNKIWTKTMSVSEIKDLLNKLEIEIAKYDFEKDNNFIMNSRRKYLKEMLEVRLQEKDGNINELINESLFNFWEFINDEYPGNMVLCSKELGIPFKDFEEMDKMYREKGIICLQEKDLILEMIKTIKNYI